MRQYRFAAAVAKLCTANAPCARRLRRYRDANYASIAVASCTPSTSDARVPSLAGWRSSAMVKALGASRARPNCDGSEPMDSRIRGYAEQPRWQRVELARASQCDGAATKAVVDLRLRRRAIVSDDHGNRRRSMAHPIRIQIHQTERALCISGACTCIRFAGYSTCRRNHARLPARRSLQFLRPRAPPPGGSPVPPARACLVARPTTCSVASWESRTGGCGTRGGIRPNLVGGVVGLAAMGPSRLAPCRALHPAGSHSGA